jgi:hypothetical protein
VYVVWGAIGKHRIYGFNLPFQEQGYDKRFVFTLSNYTQDLMVSGPLRSDDAYQFIGYCPTSQQAVMQKAQDVLTNVLLLEAYESASTAHLEQETAE